MSITTAHITSFREDLPALPASALALAAKCFFMSRPERVRRACIARFSFGQVVYLARNQQP